MDKVVTAVFEDRDRATRAADALRAHGAHEEDLRVVDRAGLDGVRDIGLPAERTAALRASIGSGTWVVVVRATAETADNAVSLLEAQGPSPVGASRVHVDDAASQGEVGHAHLVQDRQGSQRRPVELPAEQPSRTEQGPQTLPPGRVHPRPSLPHGADRFTQGDARIADLALDDAFREDHDRRFATRDLDYVETRPAYALGAILGFDDDRSWQDVAPEARRRWEAERPGTWPVFKLAVEYGFHATRMKRNALQR